MTTQRDNKKQERLVRAYSNDRPEIPLMAFWKRFLESRKRRRQLEQSHSSKQKDNEQQETEDKAEQPPKRRVIRINRQQLLMTLSVLAFMAWWQLYLRSL